MLQTVFLFLFFTFVSVSVTYGADVRCVLANECDGSGTCDSNGSHWACINHQCECRSHNTSVFIYHSERLSYNDAKAACLRRDTQLVKINSTAKYDLLKHFLDAQSSLNDPWIGIHLDEAQKPKYVYRYVDGEVATFFVWDRADGEPNNQYRDYCIRLKPSNKQYRTTTCSDRHAYVCEKVSKITCTAKSDCQYQCNGAPEYHCVDHACTCGALTG